jgi:integrase
MKDIKNLKKIINQAVQNDWLEKNPFTNFKCSYKYVERQVLTMEEINVIETKEFKMPRLQHVRDLFIFSCYTGLAYADVMNLTQKSIVLGIDGERWIYTNRQKTDSRVRVPLLPKALAIIEKYKTDPLVINSGFLLPHLSNQKLNSYLDEIKNNCEIDKHLTFHLARHTFATTITLTNGVPMETVSKLLGHSSIKTTQIYAKVIEKKVSEDMSLLKSRLSENISQKKVSNL